MAFIESIAIIPRSKIKRMNLVFTNHRKSDIQWKNLDTSIEMIELCSSNDYKKKERIKKLKLKEPVKKSSWDDCTDKMTEIKERMLELKLKGPVKKTSYKDSFEWNDFEWKEFW